MTHPSFCAKSFAIRPALSAPAMSLSEASTPFVRELKKYPKPDILARIAKALGVEVFELFKGDLVPSDSKEMAIKKVSVPINDIPAL